MLACRSMPLAAFLCLALAACSRTDAPTAAPHAVAAPHADGGRGIAYEVVTVERPESVADYHRLYRLTYENCAQIRQAKKMGPPPPMKQPPADYITQRLTYISDGKAYLVKEEHFDYVVADLEPGFTCETRARHTVATELVRDGKIYNTSIDENGKRSSDPPEDDILPRDRNKDALYTEPKTIKGFATKCMPMLPNTDKLMTSLCIADLKPGSLFMAHGDPVVLSSRVTIVANPMAVMVTEPLQVKVGQPVDKAQLDAAAAP